MGMQEYFRITMINESMRVKRDSWPPHHTLKAFQLPAPLAGITPLQAATTSAPSMEIKSTRTLLYYKGLLLLLVVGFPLVKEPQNKPLSHREQNQVWLPAPHFKRFCPCI